MAPLGLLKVATSVVLGAVGLLILSMQPLLYGNFVRENILSSREVGILTAIEMTGITLGSGVAIPLLRRLPAGWIVTVALAVQILGNVVHPTSGASAMLFAARALSGLGGGLLSGLTYVAIARTNRVGSWTALFQLVQSGLGFLAMGWFTFTSPNATSGGVQHVLAVIYAVGFALAAIVWTVRAPLAVTDAAAGTLPSTRGLSALFAVMLFTGGSLGIWAYLSVWLTSRGILAVAIERTLTLSLMSQMAGAFIAIMVCDGRHVRTLFTLGLGIMVTSMSIWLIYPAMWLAFCVFSTAWTIMVPLFTEMLLVIDPSRRTLPYAGTAQIAGIAILPALMGIALADKPDRLILGGIVIMATGGILVECLRRARPSVQPTAAFNRF